MYRGLQAAQVTLIKNHLAIIYTI